MLTEVGCLQLFLVMVSVDWVVVGNSFYHRVKVLESGFHTLKMRENICRNEEAVSVPVLKHQNNMMMVEMWEANFNLFFLIVPPAS